MFFVCLGLRLRVLGCRVQGFCFSGSEVKGLIKHAHCLSCTVFEEDVVPSSSHTIGAFIITYTILGFLLTIIVEYNIPQN